MNDAERAIEDLKDINTILKTQHMCKVLDDELTKKDAEDYKSRFASVNLAISALEKQLNGGWIPFEAEYDRYFKMDMLQGKLPEEEQEILVTDGENVWVDTFMRDGIECYLDSGSSLVDKVTAWQPLPEPYKEVGQ